jgi:hypothetical protein
MRSSHDPQENFPASRDFARVEADPDWVVLEANEWDTAIRAYRTVTLYLSCRELIVRTFTPTQWGNLAFVLEEEPAFAGLMQ